MIKTLPFCIPILFLLLFANRVMAQEEFISIEDSAYFKIETKDGNTYTGKILENAPSYLRLETENIGIVQLPKKEISKIRELTPKEFLNEDYRWFDYLHSSRYFYGPSGYGLKKGDAYYQNVWVMFNQFAVGFSDHFSVGVGFIPLFLFAGASTPIWITPKVSVPVVKDKFNLGAGGLFGGVVGEDWASFGIVYGSATVGRRDLNFSLGLGYGYYGDEYEDHTEWAQRPTISLSGMAKVGDKFYFITENYVFEDFGLYSIGGRSLIRSVTLDYGLVVPSATGGELFTLPWLGLVVPIETNLKR